MQKSKDFAKEKVVKTRRTRGIFLMTPFEFLGFFSFLLVYVEILYAREKDLTDIFP